MRPVQPRESGYALRGGHRIAFDVYGDEARPTIVLLPPWEAVDARAFKMQIPTLARHYRVVAFDPLGAGRSDKPTAPGTYDQTNRMANAIAVMDATGTRSAIAVGFSVGGEIAVDLALFHPDRIDGLVSIGGSTQLVPDPPAADQAAWDPASGSVPEGLQKWSLEWWHRDFRDWAEWLMQQVQSDPHSSKGQEDGVAWILEHDPDVLWRAVEDGRDIPDDEIERRVRTSTTPMLVLHGTEDRMIDVEHAHALARTAPNAELRLLEGAGHGIHARFPVWVNRAILEFADHIHGAAPTQPATVDTAETAETAGSRGDALAAAAWSAAPAGRRALYLSSPIGLGHARRDIAIAEAIRREHPDVSIEWLAQDPVTRALAATDFPVHPASAILASESAHFEHECAEHSLHAFQAMRKVDEIDCFNFHILDEVLASTPYDLVIADESWSTDHHLFENPRLKRAPLAWLTDFVGILPMPDADQRERTLTADYNLQMLEHVESVPDLRDVSVFVGDPDDIVASDFGPGLPPIRAWTEEHFDFAGYITGFDPRELADRDALRAELGFARDEKVCIVSVGGTDTGSALLERVVRAHPVAARRIPGLRTIVVAGPRIDPASLPSPPGVEVHGYLDRLPRWLAASDVAVVQGGLTTTMELTALRVPFIYVPLRGHFEQNLHVRTRLERYRAGECMEYDALDPDALAEAIERALTRPVTSSPVAADGAERAAGLIGRLL